ncbi:MAG: lytic murein transglycosylase [Candidatus Colwellbacteria bacterium]|nr:lytic murein transglycosylase [Candidatus Colwellbacteria bacterium]
MRLRPKVLVDIVSKGSRTPFSDMEKRLNLGFKPDKKRFRVSSLRALFVVCGIVGILGFSSVVAPTTNISAETIDNSSERQALESELQKLETQIAEYERTVSEYQKQGSTLKGEISRLTANISKMNLQVKAISINLDKLSGDIRSTTNKISATESDMESKKQLIASAIRDIDKNENQNLLEILVANPSLSDFFGNVNNILIIQSGLQENLKSLEELRVKYLDEKEQLGLERTDAENLKAYQERQRQMIEELKKSKNNVLTVTKGKESEYQKLLTKTKATAAEIRSRLFHLLGGGEMTFDQAYKYASFAERATGIRSALLLAVLDQESALGKNVGRCDYKTAMHPKRDIPAFLEIIDTLGLQGDLAAGKIKVSCPIASDGAYGGAMGPSQFIPSTWKIYMSRISEITGAKVANPWNNQDAFVATALYLKDAYNSSDCVNYGAKNKAIANEQMLKERCAAAKYYAGSRWYTYRFAYGEPVIDRAAGFEADIAILNSSQASR